MIELVAGEGLLLEVSDNCDAAPATRFLDCWSDEPDDGLGDGHTTGDCEVLADRVRLRRERSGLGNGRTYFVTLEVVDEAGNRAEAVAMVTVPHDQRRGDCR